MLTTKMSIQMLLAFHQYKANAPPPTYLSHTELCECTQVTKEQLFSGFTIPPTGGLLYINKEVIRKSNKEIECSYC